MVKIYSLKARIDDDSIQEIELYTNKKTAMEHFRFFVEESKNNLKWNKALWIRQYKSFKGNFIPTTKKIAYWERQ